MHNWAGLRNDIPVTNFPGLKDDHHGKRTRPCPNLWRFTIGWDGRVGLCFHDANFQHVIGNLNLESITNVWQGNHLNKRREQLKSVYSGLCDGCISSLLISASFFTIGLPLFEDINIRSLYRLLICLSRVLVLQLQSMASFK